RGAFCGLRRNYTGPRSDNGASATDSFPPAQRMLPAPEGRAAMQPPDWLLAADIGPCFFSRDWRILETVRQLPPQAHRARPPPSPRPARTNSRFETSD